MIVNDGRRDVNVLTEDRCRVDGERCSGLEARKRLDGVVIDVGKRKVHTCGCFPQSYGPYEVREKTQIILRQR